MKRIIGLGFAGLLLSILAGGLAFPQGAVTLVQIMLGGAAISGSNPLPVSGTFSASFSGFPTIQSTGTPISVTTGGVTGTLPTGTVVVASNVGATNGAYCKLGASATTSDQLIPPNSWFAFTVGANTQLTCITSTSTTTVNMVGGSGLPTGSGGGGGGGGSGGTVTQGPTGTNAAAWWTQIGDTTNGPVAVATAGADAVSNTQNGLAGYARNEVFNGTTWDRLRSGTTTGSALINGAGTAGTASGGILTVQGIASMTPLLATITGSLTANQSVNVAQVNGVTTLTGTGAVGTGAQRIAVGADTATIAGSAPGTAGTPSANIVTVQGATSMTKLLVTPDSVALPANQSVNVNQWDGTALGVPTAYGTAPTTGNYLGVNAFVTNTNANGQATMANSSPVVIASNQTSFPVIVAAGSAAIGSIFGPTAVGSANANPPIVIGGTATGAAGSNVQGLSIVAPSTAPVTATNTAVVVDLRPDSPGIITLGPAAPANAVPTIPSSPYPGNATAVAVPINASSGNVAAGTAAASLAAAASKFTYMTGFQFTSSGSTVGLPVICTITGIATTKSFIVTSVAGVLLANAPLIVQFNPPLQSSAVNTAVVASCPSLGTGNTNAVMTADGYQL